MRTALILLAVLALPASAAQTVWKWVDAQGVTHYSDRPVAGATKVEISSANTAEAQPAYSPPAAAERAERPQTSSRYQSLEITRPASGESFINTGGVVPVSVAVRPALRPGHQLRVYLDGRAVEGLAPDAANFDLQQVPRGEHRVHAAVVDGSGRTLRETSPVTFIVRQESIANPPVGPAIKPPPKPRPSAKLPAQQPSHASLNGARAQIDPVTNAPRK
jgi:hypothetical protein